MESKNTFVELVSNIETKWSIILLNTPINNRIMIDEKVLCEKNITPARENIFSVFNLFEPEDTKVIIVLQDPYPTKNMANGIAMGWNIVNLPNKYAGSTLTNFVNAMKISLDIQTYLEYDPSLINIAKQGVLLMNASLTTVVGSIDKPHYNYWKPVTSHIMKEITGMTSNLLILLLGDKARNLRSSIDKKRNHEVYIDSHPSSHNVNKPFKLAKTDFFKKMVERGIEWR